MLLWLRAETVIEQETAIDPTKPSQAPIPHLLTVPSRRDIRLRLLAHRRIQIIGVLRSVVQIPGRGQERRWVG